MWIFGFVPIFCLFHYAGAQGCTSSQIVSSDVEMDEGANAREWIDEYSSRRTNHPLSPLNRRNTQLKRMMIDLEIDGQNFVLIFDTGSDLTWIPAKGITLDSKYNLRFQNYYEPVDGRRRAHFRREYGVRKTSTIASGFEYYGPVKFSNAQCTVNMTYGVADYVRFNSNTFAAVFGASKRFSADNPFPMIENPDSRRIFRKAIFTTALKPWRRYEYFEPRRPEMGSVEFGGLNRKYCSPQIAYSRPYGGGHWRLDVGKIFFGFTRNASHDFHPNGFAREMAFEAKDAAVDSGNPGICLPNKIFDEITTEMPHGYFPVFRCNDSEIRAELHIQMAEPPFHTVKMDLRHLMQPQFPGSDFCTLKMIPSGSEFILGLPFYAAAGCVVHDYIQKRVGITTLLNNNSTSSRLWKKTKNDVNMFNLLY